MPCVKQRPTPSSYSLLRSAYRLSFVGCISCIRMPFVFHLPRQRSPSESLRNKMQNREVTGPKTPYFFQVTLLIRFYYRYVTELIGSITRERRLDLQDRFCNESTNVRFLSFPSFPHSQRSAPNRPPISHAHAIQRNPTHPILIRRPPCPVRPMTGGSTSSMSFSVPFSGL
jgi:hypothetical protein